MTSEKPAKTELLKVATAGSGPPALEPDRRRLLVYLHIYVQVNNEAG